jgi:3-polyprenyl-4-hydroxybenzoate decarboxylase
MEELNDLQSPPAAAKDHAVRWRDLREWLALVENDGRLMRIRQPVDTDEELAAITLMAARRENAPALLFESPSGDRFGARVLANMLGSSKERYALAVGLDPRLSTAEMIVATRAVMSRRIAPVHVPAATAPVNDIVLQGDDLRNTWSTGLDPSQYVPEQRPYGSKALINACKPHRYIKQFPPSTLLRRSVYDRVSARWAELGFEEPPPKLTVFHPE